MTKRIVSLLLVSVMVLSLSACKKGKDNEKEQKMAYGTVWSAPTSVKINKEDVNYAAKEEAALVYQAVKNEYESAQLIITADKEIKSYELVTSDLKCGDEVLSAEHATVYMQKYIPLNDSDYGTGAFPDALIPMKTAKEYEENIIEKDSNGALWVTIYVPKETKAGKYEGTYQLIADGKEGKVTIDVPVSCEVYDYTLTDETTARSLFTWRYDRVAVGELDGSLDMMKTYYEYFLDYRITLQHIPVETLTSEEVGKTVSEYYDRITAYGINNQLGEMSGFLDSAPQRVYDQILGIAAYCTEEKNLLDKAMIYFIDEPSFSDESTRKSFVTRMDKMVSILRECVAMIKADTTGKYDALKTHDNWEETIIDIPRIVPIGIGWMVDNGDTEEGKIMWESMNCICPNFTSEASLLKALDYAKQYDVDVWWYGCAGPTAPGANYHIGDKNLLSPRTYSWLQNEYNILGNLYWDAASYSVENSQQKVDDEYVNPFTYPYRQYSTFYPAGDGSLTYPGAAYGLYGPLPSMRLMAIRDGLEEYEILHDLETRIEKIADECGEDFTPDEALAYFYDSVGVSAGSSGGGMYVDGENGLNFTTLRGALLQLAEAFEVGRDFTMGSMRRESNEVSFDYYVAGDVTVKLNDEAQSPVAGMKYQYTIDLEQETDVTIEIAYSDGETVIYKRTIGYPTWNLNDLSEKSVLDGIELTEGSTATLETSNQYSTDGTSVHFKVNGKLTGDALKDAIFRPSVAVQTSLFGEHQLKDMGKVSIDFYNPGEEFKMMLRLYSGDSYCEVATITVAAGSSTYTFDVSILTEDIVKNADSFQFVFDNTGKEEQVLSYDFYMDNIVGESAK